MQGYSLQVHRHVYVLFSAPETEPLSQVYLPTNVAAYDSCSTHLPWQPSSPPHLPLCGVWRGVVGGGRHWGLELRSLQSLLLRVPVGSSSQEAECEHAATWECVCICVRQVASIPARICIIIPAHDSVAHCISIHPVSSSHMLHMLPTSPHTKRIRIGVVTLATFPYVLTQQSWRGWRNHIQLLFSRLPALTSGTQGLSTQPQGQI